MLNKTGMLLLYEYAYLSNGHFLSLAGSVFVPTAVWYRIVPVPPGARIETWTF